MSTPVSKPKPVRILGAVAASGLVLASGLPLLTPDRFDWIGPAVGLGAAVITAGLTKFTEDKTVPDDNVEARIVVDDEGQKQIVAGKGSEIPTGAPVDVTPSTDTNWAA